ncbi:MAG: hypothetical protein AMXMBFR83_04560 [Phycisphaerae bacterium]
MSAAARCVLPGLMICCAARPCPGEQRRQDFAADPGWDGHNNRGDKVPCRTTSQDFGYSADTAHAGGAKGEIGGVIQMAAEPAYYALRLPRPLTFNDRLSATGRIAFPDDRGGPLLIGFFNARNSIAWRTRNSLAIRLDHRGTMMHAHVEYATDKWRAGAGGVTVTDPASGKVDMQELPVAGVHRWTLDYDPGGRDDGGRAVFTIDGRRAEMTVSADHKADGAFFDRFGVLNVMKSSDNRVRFYLDDVTVNGHTEDFSRDPGWEGVGNRKTYEDCVVRPKFDFGFSPTAFAGGRPGELGGVVFRGDNREAHKMACYGDRLEPLTLRAPLRASGRVALTRGVSDSTVLIGWFNRELSLRPGKSDVGLPPHFLGVMVEGPSSEGFFFRPAMRAAHEDAYARGPVILPDGRPHQWEVRFVPKADGREGTLAVRLDGQSAELELKDRLQLSTARFDRFGIVTTCIDGNYQFIYFDDLEYTCRQDEPRP